MSEEPPREIVIVRRRGGLDEGGHKGGAWKIAFADFMTAMMAFFLVMWLLSANEKTKASIAHYFNPVKLADTTVQKKGLHEAKEIEPAPPSDSKDAKNVSAPPAVESVAVEGKPKQSTLSESRTAEVKAVDGKSAAPKADEAKGPDSKEAKVQESKPDPKNHEGGPFARIPSFSEAALFGDPDAALTEIAGRPPAGDNPTTTPGGPANSNLPGGDPFRDPFAPSVHENAKAPPTRAAEAVTPRSRPLRSPANIGYAETPKASIPNNDSKKSGKSAEEPLEPADAASPPEQPKKPAQQKRSDQPIPPEQQKQSDQQKPSDKPDQQAAQAVAADLRASLTKALKDASLITDVPKISVQQVDEGVLISLTDDVDFAMFASASAQPDRKVIDIMDKIAGILKSHPGSLVVRGHTDGRPFKSAAYDNWRLSQARAQMAYYMLRRGGLDEKRFEKIEGYADRRLKIPTSPDAAENRRIEILLREDKP
jgi:chemotaxis protein MotB